MAQALEALAAAERVTPFERLSAGFDQREQDYQAALTAAERLAGRPLEHREKNELRKSLNKEGSVR
jgi:DNA invertase Pin-like site-specific DNA recombinase